MRSPQPVGRAAAQQYSVDHVYTVYGIEKLRFTCTRGRPAHVDTATTPFRCQNDGATGSMNRIRPVSDQNALNVGQRIIHFWPFGL